MSSTFEVYDVKGRQFENEVAHYLRGQGFRVHQRCYVPYYPGCSNTAEVDILAIRDGIAVVFECKAGSGIYVGGVDDDTWTRTYTLGNKLTCNPIQQSQRQVRAVERNLKCRVISMVVTENSVGADFGVDKGIINFSGLPAYVRNLKEAQGDFLMTPTAKLALYDWEHPSDEVRAAHVTHVLRNRNKDTLKVFKEGQGVDMYCISLLDRYFYCFEDAQGRCWGTEDIEEAALFTTQREAEEALYDCGITGEVCTLRFGYVEFMSAIDIPEELTPEEYAYEVGAYPYCM